MALGQLVPSYPALAALVGAAVHVLLLPTIPRRGRLNTVRPPSVNARRPSLCYAVGAVQRPRVPRTRLTLGAMRRRCRRRRNVDENARLT